jgi:hypothetical protein
VLTRRRGFEHGKSVADYFLPLNKNPQLLARGLSAV